MFKEAGRSANVNDGAPDDSGWALHKKSDNEGYMTISTKRNSRGSAISPVGRIVKIFY